uniref:core-binding factor subunit beta-like isoform X3 n=1 Tax=Myxine glutinosa TaxID=7769 RepID=UPI00358F5851
MPRVVPDQRSKFESEEFFRKLSRECEVRYTGYRDRPIEERQMRFQTGCRDGRSDVSDNVSSRAQPGQEFVDFEREAGKVFLQAPMILNGVCVTWRGWVDLQRLDGMACLQFDEERARAEDLLAQQNIEESRRRTREFEHRERQHREDMQHVISPFRDKTELHGSSVSTQPRNNCEADVNMLSTY